MQTKYAENTDWILGTSLLEIVNAGDSSIKTASESFEYASNLPKSTSTTPIVVIAMGTTESYGPNRNADGFNRNMLLSTHPSFKQFGHVFVNHKNKDPKTSIGSISNSFFNDVMDRVELVLSLDNSKAQKFIQRIHDGLPIPVSMGIHIKFDVCNICGNKAPTKKQWCEHMQPKGIFGPNTLYHVEQDPSGKYPKQDGKQIFVDNPNGNFFDISMVTRNADMTAFMIYGPKALEINGGCKHAFDTNEATTVDPDYAVYSREKSAGLLEECKKSIKTRPQKVADMIKKIDGMAGSLEIFKKDPNFLTKKAAEFIASAGIEQLSSLLEESNTQVSYPEMFKLAHMALFDRIPSQLFIKQASLYQSDMVSFVAETPTLTPFLDNTYKLNTPADWRKVSFLKRETAPKTHSLEGATTSTSSKEAAFSAVIAANLFIKQNLSVTHGCIGRAIAGEENKKRVNTKTATLLAHETPEYLFREVLDFYSGFIFI